MNRYKYLLKTEIILFIALSDVISLNTYISYNLDSFFLPKRPLKLEVFCVISNADLLFNVCLLFLFNFPIVLI